MHQYPEGANWEKGVYREPIAVIISFGTKKIDSGSWAVPNMPYFIGLFLGNKESAGKGYKGNYYHKGGRYFCEPCQNAPGKTVTTEVELEQRFKQTFGESSMPPITGIAFEVDTRDTKGKSKAFIKAIEFLGK